MDVNDYHVVQFIETLSELWRRIYQHPTITQDENNTFYHQMTTKQKIADDYIKCAKDGAANSQFTVHKMNARQKSLLNFIAVSSNTYA